MSPNSTLPWYRWERQSPPAYKNQMAPRLLLLWLCPIWLPVILSSGLFAQENPVSDPGPESDVSARSKALELAGAFSNDGYKIRDGYWPGEIEPNRPQFLEVNLFSGNEYWFSAAVNPPGRKIAVACSTKSASQWTSKPTRTGRLRPQVSSRKSAVATM